MVSNRDADVIVVGAGTGGLTTAAYLAAAGKQVLVVDRGSRPGGHGTVFERGGREFDIGLHTIASGMDGKPTPDGFLAPLGIALRWNRIDPVETVVLDGGSRFELPVGIDAYRNALHDALPDERGAIDRYLRLIAALDKHVNALSTVAGPAGLPGALRHVVPLVRYRNTTLSDVFDRLQLSPRARLLLSETCGFYGLPPSQAPVALHALYITARVRGSWYPAGGGPSIAGGLAEVVTAHGGQFLLGHEVTRIEVRGGAVTGVEVRDVDGATRQLGAEVVVSNADIKRTFLDLLPPDAVPEALRRKVRGFTMSLPIGVVYLVLDRDLAAEGAPVTDFLVAGDDTETAFRAAQAGRFTPRPWVWMSVASVKDPGNERLCRPGQTNLQVSTIVPSHPEAWGLQAGETPGEAYAAAKRAFRDQMMAGADQVFPGLSSSVVFAEVATPYTFSRYMRTTDGTSYGIALTADQIASNRPAATTPIRGLFLVGASTRAGPGIPMVIAGGVQTATAVLGSPAVDAVRQQAAA
jgi:phytoene dehydrogenase-like protein